MHIQMSASEARSPRNRRGGAESRKSQIRLKMPTETKLAFFDFAYLMNVRRWMKKIPKYVAQPWRSCIRAKNRDEQPSPRTCSGTLINQQPRTLFRTKVGSVVVVEPLEQLSADAVFMAREDYALITVDS